MIGFAAGCALTPCDLGKGPIHTRTHVLWASVSPENSSAPGIAAAPWRVLTRCPAPGTSPVRPESSHSAGPFPAPGWCLATRGQQRAPHGWSGDGAARLGSGENWSLPWGCQAAPRRACCRPRPLLSSEERSLGPGVFSWGCPHPPVCNPKRTRNMPFLGQHPLPPLQHRCLSSPLSEHFHVMVGSGVSTHRVSQGRSLLTAQPLAFSGPGVPHLEDGGSCCDCG